jgi:hypothetical protein
MMILISAGYLDSAFNLKHGERCFCGRAGFGGIRVGLHRNCIVVRLTASQTDCMSHRPEEPRALANNTAGCELIQVLHAPGPDNQCFSRSMPPSTIIFIEIEVVTTHWSSLSLLKLPYIHMARGELFP